jgi:glycosyltransferase involved in cell wall biosynthesis
VIAWRCGSTPEVVENGLTGFIVNSDAEADQAVWRAKSLDRAAVRCRFEQRFSSAVMASQYVNLYGGLAPANPQVDSAAKRLDPELMRIA